MAASEPVVGPRVLVVVATKHGATREIAEAIVRDLAVSDDGRAMRLTALRQEAEHAPGPAGFDAVVIGSAVYAGRCRPRPATDVRGSTAVGLLVGGG
ncbi:MAG: Menaquinone-dependent protoporphyrinogen oxidase [Blastococcus sp.]|nr:Menaquinone-dependent protoporphyrinogen oxidase [Blastococcus sp.]